MKARWLVGALGLGAITATLIACATDDNTAYTQPDAGPTTIPDPDAGDIDAGAADADATAPTYVCSPDELCPTDLFDPGRPGGALDLRTRIRVLRGRSATDVWAAGVQGTVAHYDGTSWTRSDTGSKETINGLWLRTSGEIALASIGSVYTRGLDVADAGAPSAGGWSALGAPLPVGSVPSLPNGNRVLESVWSSPEAEWAWCATVEAPLVGTAPTGLWRMRVGAPEHEVVEVASPFAAGTCDVLPCSRLTSIHGASADVLWAVGYTGATVRISNAQSDTPEISAFDSKTWSGLNGVWAASDTEAWSVGGGGTIRHYTGHSSSWEIVNDVPTTEDLRAVWGTSPTDVWAVGDGSVVLHYDGKAWTHAKIGGLGDRRPNLHAVWSPAPGHVWIGGEGVLLSFGGKS